MECIIVLFVLPLLISHVFSRLSAHCFMSARSSESFIEAAASSLSGAVFAIGGFCGAGLFAISVFEVLLGIFGSYGGADWLANLVCFGAALCLWMFIISGAWQKRKRLSETAS